MMFSDILVILMYVAILCRILRSWKFSNYIQLDFSKFLAIFEVIQLFFMFIIELLSSVADSQ